MVGSTGPIPIFNDAPELQKASVWLQTVLFFGVENWEGRLTKSPSILQHLTILWWIGWVLVASLVGKFLFRRLSCLFLLMCIVGRWQATGSLGKCGSFGILPNQPSSLSTIRPDLSKPWLCPHSCQSDRYLETCLVYLCSELHCIDDFMLPWIVGSRRRIMNVLMQGRH